MMLCKDIWKDFNSQVNCFPWRMVKEKKKGIKLKEFNDFYWPFKIEVIIFLRLWTQESFFQTNKKNVRKFMKFIWGIKCCDYFKSSKLKIDQNELLHIIAGPITSKIITFIFKTLCMLTKKCDFFHFLYLTSFTLV